MLHPIVVVNRQTHRQAVMLRERLDVAVASHCLKEKSSANLDRVWGLRWLMHIIQHGQNRL